MNEVFLLLNEHYRKLPMPKKGKEEEIDSTVLGKKTKRQKKQKKPNNK